MALMKRLGQPGERVPLQTYASSHQPLAALVRTFCSTLYPQPIGTKAPDLINTKLPCKGNSVCKVEGTMKHRSHRLVGNSHLDFSHLMY